MIYNNCFWYILVSVLNINKYNTEVPTVTYDSPFDGNLVVKLVIFYVLYVLLCYACGHITTKLFKKGPGGYLIRVDLIRFPGSIPGAR